MGNPAAKARLKGAEQHLTQQQREQLMRAVKGAGSYPVDDVKVKAATGRLRKKPTLKNYEKVHSVAERRPSWRRPSKAEPWRAPSVTSTRRP